MTLRDRLPPVQTQVDGANPNLLASPARSSTTSPESFFAQTVIQHFNRRRDKYAAMAKLAGAAGLPLPGVVAKPNTRSTRGGSVASSGGDKHRDKDKKRRHRTKAPGNNTKLLLGSGPLHPDLNLHSQHNLSLRDGPTSVLEDSAHAYPSPPHIGEGTGTEATSDFHHPTILPQARKASLPAYSALDPYGEPDYAGGLLEKEAAKSNASSPSRGRPLTQVDEEDMDTSLIGSGADDLRPRLGSVGGAEWVNGGGMGPAVFARMEGAETVLMTPRSAVSRIPEEVVDPPNVAYPNVSPTNQPSSRDSALQKVPTATLLQLLRSAEEESETYKAKYIATSAEAGAYRAAMGRLEAKLGSSKERERDHRERAKHEKERERERMRKTRQEREKVAERARVLEQRVKEMEVRTKDVEQRAQERVREVEKAKMAQSLSLGETILGLQRSLGALEREYKVLSVKSAYVQGELGKAEEAVRRAEEERDEKEREAVEARRCARKVKEEVYVKVAKEEGRREGWEEGMKRGKGMAEALVVGHAKGLVGDGMAYIEDVTSPVGGNEEDEERRRRARKKDKAKQAEYEREKEQLVARMKEMEQMIQQERERVARMEREKASVVGSVVGKVHELEGRLKDREREVELERERRAWEAEQAKVREIRDKEVHRQREAEEERKRDERDRERRAEEEERKRIQRQLEEERKQMERQVEEERKKVERELGEQVSIKAAQDAAAAAERERSLKEEALVRQKELQEALAKEKEEKGRLEKELVSARTPQVTLAYLPMPVPPAPAPAIPVETASTTSSRRPRRREHRDSGSDTASDLGALDILNLPSFGGNTIERDVGLGTIHQGASTVAVPQPPMWMDKPPANYKEHQQGPGAYAYANPTDYLSPQSGGGGYGGGGGSGRNLRKMGSGSTSNSWDIRVVPPTRPGSAMQHDQLRQVYGPPSLSSPPRRQQQQYLSPNMAQQILPHPPRTPSSPSVPSAPTSGPYDRHPHPEYETPRTTPSWGMSMGGGLPIGFMPQSVTMTPSMRGRMAMPMAMVDGRSVDDDGNKGSSKERRGKKKRLEHEHDYNGGGGYSDQVSTMRVDAGRGMPEPTSTVRANAGFGMPEPSSSVRDKAGMGMPEPTVGGRVPSSSSSGGGGMSMPEPTVPMYPGVPRTITAGSAGVRTPGYSSSVAGGSARQTPRNIVTMPEPTVPNIVPPPGSSRTPRGTLMTMPELTVPKIIPPPGSSRTPSGGSGLTMPEPTVPNTIPSSGSSRTPGGTFMTMPEPTVPNIIPPPGSSRTPAGGGAMSMPSPTVTNIVPESVTAMRASKRGGKKERGLKKSNNNVEPPILTMPSPTIPSYSSPNDVGGGGVLSMPEPSVIDYTRGGGRGGPTPQPDFAPVIPSMPGGMTGDSPLAMPQPEIVDYVGGHAGRRTPGGIVVGMPEPSVDYTGSGRRAEPPMLPSSVDVGGGGFSAPTLTVIGAPVIPGVTTGRRRGKNGAANDDDDGDAEEREVPFIPPPDPSDYGNTGGSGSGGGGGIFGGVASVFGGSGWGSAWVSNGASSNNHDEGEDEPAFGGGGGGFVPPDMRDNGDDDDDVDSATMRNTRMNAQMAGVGSDPAGGKRKKTKGKKR